MITDYQDETGGVEQLARDVANAAARGDRDPAQRFIDANCTSQVVGQ